MPVSENTQGKGWSSTVSHQIAKINRSINNTTGKTVERHVIALIILHIIYT
jgi:hypothetical protein